MKVKITDKKGQTKGGMQWGEGVTHRATGEGKDLCSDGVIHYYESPELAVFANPVHGNYNPGSMLLWEFKPKRRINGDYLKSVCKEGTTIKQVALPAITTEQRVTVAIKVALLVCHDCNFVKWAEGWLSGEYRSINSARTATMAATSAATWAASAATRAAARAAAYAAASAADAAAWAAAYAAWAASAAAWAADAAAWAASAAAWAASAADVAADVAARAAVDIQPILNEVLYAG